jgi:cold-inducible RNA-binding protein
MGRRLYVGNLPFKTTNEDLSALFAQAGPVEDVQVMRDLATGRARGFAFVQMANDDAAQKAITQFHEYALEGRPLVVNEARPRTPGAPGMDGARGGVSARPPRW